MCSIWVSGAQNRHLEPESCLLRNIPKADIGTFDLNSLKRPMGPYNLQRPAHGPPRIWLAKLNPNKNRDYKRKIYLLAIYESVTG